VTKPQTSDVRCSAILSRSAENGRSPGPANESLRDHAPAAIDAAQRLPGIRLTNELLDKRKPDVHRVAHGHIPRVVGTGNAGVATEHVTKLICAIAVVGIERSRVVEAVRTLSGKKRARSASLLARMSNA
jgi:hypothetical protein